MRKLYFLSLIAAAFCITACSKKSDVTPTTDPRIGTVSINGATYSTIIIGTQTWTSTNYSLGTGSLAKADATYGNYYTLAQAQAITLPTGWRIPTVADYNKMLSTFSTASQTTSGNYTGDITVARALADTGKFHSLDSFGGTLKATNSSGFDAYAGGVYNTSNQTFVNQQIDAAFLTSTTGAPYGTTVNYFFGIASDNVAIGNSTQAYYVGIDNYTGYAYSLRFVKDN